MCTCICGAGAQFLPHTRAERDRWLEVLAPTAAACPPARTVVPKAALEPATAAAPVVPDSCVTQSVGSAYAARQRDELSLRVGDVVRIVQHGE